MSRARLLMGLAILLAARDASGAAQAMHLQPSAIAWIPESTFTMGANSDDIAYAVQLCQDEYEFTLADECGPERFQHETPPRRTHIGAFGLLRTEVTQAAYTRCVAASRCAPSRETSAALRGADLPVVGISMHDAADYCAFIHGRLPTEEEWEFAARGDDARRFPWGRVYDAALGNHGRPPLREDHSDGFAGLAPVASQPANASPFGVLDLAGNAWEWTSSSPRAVDVGGADRIGALRILRGGSFLHPAVSLRVTARMWVNASSVRADVGFRCAFDAP